MTVENIMQIEELEKSGFCHVGRLTVQRPNSMRERMHGVYFEGDRPKKKGVYFLSKGDEIVKIGDAQGVNGLHSRIEMYLSNTESTNAHVRDALKKDKVYEVYFFETKSEDTEIMGMKVEKSISPRSLEQALIEKFEKEFRHLPRLNRVRM